MPPLPSSDWKIMSPSSALFLISKLPVELFKRVLVPVWYIEKSLDDPRDIMELSGQYVYNDVVALPSWVAELPSKIK